MQASGFAGATVRQVMDMTTGIDYSENYADPQATIWTHMYAGGMLARPPGAAGPDNFFSYMPTVGARGEHGAEFTYRTVNTDVLGWILRRVAGCNFSDLVSQLLWQPMGAELDACYTVDSCGVEFVGVGMGGHPDDFHPLGDVACDFPRALADGTGGPEDDDAAFPHGTESLAQRHKGAKG